MTDNQSQDDHRKKPESSAATNENNAQQDVSVDSFHTALDTQEVRESADSFQTARTQLDPLEVEERLQSLQEQQKTRTISSSIDRREEEERLDKQHIHFREDVGDDMSRHSQVSRKLKRTEGLGASGSTASIRLKKSENSGSIISTEDSDRSVFVAQVDMLSSDSFEDQDMIGHVERHSFTDSTSSVVETATPSLARVIQSPLHVGLDSKSIHSLDSHHKSLHGIKSAGLGGGYAFIYMVIPPDGGYGWIITFISFLCQIVVDGIIFGIGIVLPNMAQDLGVDARSIALVASMQIGPISCAFINKYGFRPVALVGSAIATTSIGIASFSPNLPMLIVFYSLIGGVSLSMIWISSQLIIGYYFEKYRPIANGLSCSGAGAGILTFSAMNSALVSEIGWRNVLRVHIVFLIAVFFMAITFIEVAPQKIAHVFEQATSETTSESSDIDDVQYEHRYSKTSIFSRDEKRLSERIEPFLTYESKQPEPGRITRCLRHCCPSVARASSASTIETKRYFIRSDPLEKQDLYYTGPANYEHHREELVQDIIEGKQVEMVGGKNARSVNYTLSMMHAARTAKPNDGVSGHKSVLARLSPANWLPKKIVNAFRVLFDVRLLRMMEFRILVASAFFYTMGFNVPFVFSNVRAELPAHQAAFISPAIGFSNFAFRIACGFIAYKYKDYTTYICGGGIFVGGLAVVISSYYGLDIFWFQMVYAVIFGIAPAFFSTLRAIIYVRALGLDKLTNAFGLTAMAMGTGVFIGTTLAANLNQKTGSFVASFTFGGSCMVIAGLLKLLLPSLIKCQNNRLEAKRGKVTFSV